MGNLNPVRLNALGTALPPNIFTQAAVLARARALLAPRFPAFERLSPAFLNAAFSFCLGCQIYLLLQRAGILGRAPSAA